MGKINVIQIDRFGNNEFQGGKIKADKPQYMRETIINSLLKYFIIIGVPKGIFFDPAQDKFTPVDPYGMLDVQDFGLSRRQHKKGRQIF